MLRTINSLVDRVRALRGVAPEVRLPEARRLGARHAAQAARRAKRRVVTGQIRVVQKLLGPVRASRYFWLSPLRDHTWFNVQARIDYLADRYPGHVDHFVRECIETTTDAVTIANLARHPYAADTLRRWLQSDAGVGSSRLARRLQGNRLLGGAFGGVARVLLANEPAQRAVDWVIDLYQIPDRRLLQLIDSAGWCPAADDQHHIAAAPVGKRLVIADHFNDLDAIALLLPGADATTLIAVSETFGRADFSAYEAWPGVGEIQVEHIRSRITRFSQEYIDVHGASTRVARRVGNEVESISGLLDPSGRSTVEVEIADLLFFASLKIRSIETLLNDESFDHIVLALADHQATHEFIRLLAGVDGLLDDPRLELVSTSRSAGVRSQFWDTVAALRDRKQPISRIDRHVPDALLLRKFDEEAQRLAQMLEVLPRGDRRRAWVVTTNNDAYNESTAGYIHVLRQDYDVGVLHMGRDATSLVQFLHDDDSTVPLAFLAPAPDRFGPMAERIQCRLEHCLGAVDDAASRHDVVVNWAYRCTLERLCRETIAPAIGRLRTIEHWLRLLEGTNTRPDVIVLTPQRNQAVGCVANVARRFGIPTVSLEPHVQDANYSRYVKIAADFYGVMSDYFRTQATNGFGMPLERTFTIGSPRLIAPPAYDPVRAQCEARQSFSQGGESMDDGTTYLVYFCQPSDWSHVTRVWTSVLDAARDSGCRILLKTHPEESISRVTQYLDQVAAAGMTDHVTLLDCNAATAIDLGDIVLTAYSTAGIDAALRQKPVVCVTDGDHRYPVDLGSIIGAYRATSAAELSTLLTVFREDPEPMRQQARSLIQRESQFIEGPGSHLRALIAKVLELGPAAVRDADDVPDSLFLDGPHPIYPV